MRKGGSVAPQTTTNGAPRPQQTSTAAAPTTAAGPARATSFSIKDAMQKKEVVKEETKGESFAESAERNIFTQDELIKAWNNYTQFTKEQPILQQTIQQCKPVLGTDWRIMLAVYNSAQESLMMKERIKLTNYLRNELKNGGINIEIRIYEVGESTQSLTPKEMFLKMMDHNPNLKKLAQELNLEIG